MLSLFKKIRTFLSEPKLLNGSAHLIFQWIIKTAKTIIGAELPSLYTICCRIKIKSILQDPHHPSHTLFRWRSSGRVLRHRDAQRVSAQRVSEQRRSAFITVFTQQPSDCWQRTLDKLYPISDSDPLRHTHAYAHTRTHTYIHLPPLLTHCLLLHFLHYIFILLVYLLECGPFYSVFNH